MAKSKQHEEQVPAKPRKLAEVKTDIDDPEHDEIAALDEATDLIGNAVKLRIGIDHTYRDYGKHTRLLSSIVGERVLNHADIKQGVDALHYINGGYPSPNSKGRMQATLDKVRSMLKVLGAIGQDDVFHKYCAEIGIKVELDKKQKVPDRVLSARERAAFAEFTESTDRQTPDTVHRMLAFVVNKCLSFQAKICSDANVVKKQIKPYVKRSIGMQSQEFQRAVRNTKAKVTGNLTSAVNERNRSTHSYKSFLVMSGKAPKPVRRDLSEAVLNEKPTKARKR